VASDGGDQKKITEPVDLGVSHSTRQVEGAMTMRKTNVLLWVVQALLAALFLFAGATKLVLPIEAMTKQSPLPGAFLRFIGLVEVLGALGLILPGITRIRQGLTPLAAGGLVIIMIGATALSGADGHLAPALFPAVVGLLAAVVAYGRAQTSIA
jgi:uncharacterized membrane protein YphA (DoxX/SURF4 family)